MGHTHAGAWNCVYVWLRPSRECRPMPKASQEQQGWHQGLFSAHDCWHPRGKSAARACSIKVLLWPLMQRLRDMRPFLSGLPYAISPLIWGRFTKVYMGLCRLSDLQYDEAAAAQLQAAVESERAHVQRCKDNADQLSTTLASELIHQHKLRTQASGNFASLITAYTHKQHLQVPTRTGCQLCACAHILLLQPQQLETWCSQSDSYLQPLQEQQTLSCP